MFHWICPECGREIAPGVKECPACDPQPVAVAAGGPAAAAAEPEKVLIPEIVTSDPEVRLREIVGRMRGGPVPSPAVHSAAPAPSLPDVKIRPVSAPPAAPVSAPPMVRALATPRVPDVARRLRDTTLRQPVAAAPPKALILGLKALAPTLGGFTAKVALPPWPDLAKSRIRTPRLRPTSIDSIKTAMEQLISPAAPQPAKARAAIGPDDAVQGPLLPHELSSLEGAGISHIVPVGPPPARVTLGSKIPSWVVTSLVAATVLSAGLSLAFYAAPGLASPRAKDVPIKPVVTGHALVEVTGIRIVAAKGKTPEIRYLVVNHSDAKLDGKAVKVTLRLRTAGADVAPVSQFTFTAGGLDPFESREMASPIQNMVAPGELPDWRELRADVEVGP